MVTIRNARPSDLLGMQRCNVTNLPENYSMKYYLYHLFCWPQISFVAVDTQDQVVGYVMSTTEPITVDKLLIKGHITSLSVMRDYRRLGLADKLMRQAQYAMKETYGATHVTLHVRVSNRAAFALYRDTLNFDVLDVEKKYYADGEDAYEMRFSLNEKLGPIEYDLKWLDELPEAPSILVQEAARKKEQRNVDNLADGVKSIAV
ncbi:acyl-CoA N-acyltransferase [Ramicandelaber brevisporus]|nr:acyl-CoA N-acyltransferase [Ramicandelaber brevisporus]